MVTIKVPSKYLKKAPMSGNSEYLPELAEYVNNMYLYGITPKTLNGITTAELVDDAETDFDIDHVMMLHDIPGTSIEGFQAKAYFSVVDLDVEVPNSLPNRMTSPEYDETGENIISPARGKTWREWIGKNYTCELLEGKYYFLNYAGTLRAKPLNSYEIVALSKEGVVLVNKKPDILDEPIM